MESHLISQEGGGPAERYRMLEIVREYALQQLTAGGDAADFRRSYTQYYQQWVYRLYPQLRGPQAGELVQQLASEHDNLRGVLNELLEQGEHEAAAQLSSDLLAFWIEGDHLAEGRQWLRAALATGAGATATWGRALPTAGLLALIQADYVASQGYFEASLAILRATDDRAKPRGRCGSWELMWEIAGIMRKPRHILRRVWRSTVNGNLIIPQKLIVQVYTTAAGLVGVKLHDFLRFLGTQLATQDLRKVQKALGHERIDTTPRRPIPDLATIQQPTPEPAAALAPGC